MVLTNNVGPITWHNGWQWLRFDASSSAAATWVVKLLQQKVDCKRSGVAQRRERKNLNLKRESEKSFWETQKIIFSWTPKSRSWDNSIFISLRPKAKDSRKYLSCCSCCCLPTYVYLPTYVNIRTYIYLPTYTNLPSSTYLPLPIPKYQNKIAAYPGAGIGLLFLNGLAFLKPCNGTYFNLNLSEM